MVVKSLVDFSASLMSDDHDKGNVLKHLIKLDSDWIKEPGEGMAYNQPVEDDFSKAEQFAFLGWGVVVIGKIYEYEDHV